MSKILDAITDAIVACDLEEKLPHGWVNNFDAVSDARSLVENIQPHVVSLIEVAEIQLQLFELGFKIGGVNYNHLHYVKSGVYPTSIDAFFDVFFEVKQIQTYDFNDTSRCFSYDDVEGLLKYIRRVIA